MTKIPARGMTRAEAAQIVSILLSTYSEVARGFRDPEFETRGMISAYHAALQDLDPGIVGGAVQRLIATKTFCPKPAEIRLAVDEILRGVRRPALEAWGDVVAAMKKHGRHTPTGAVERHPGVDFDFADPLVRRAVDRLGWDELVDSENRTADRARFCEIYDDLSDAERTEAVTRTLPGAAAPPRIGGMVSVEALAASVPVYLLAEGKKKP